MVYIMVVPGGCLWSKHDLRIEERGRAIGCDGVGMHMQDNT